MQRDPPWLGGALSGVVSSDPRINFSRCSLSSPTRSRSGQAGAAQYWRWYHPAPVCPDSQVSRIIFGDGRVTIRGPNKERLLFSDCPCRFQATE